jgi:hypothetical protein
VDVLVGARTFWERATLIHAECHRTGHKPDANRMSRHWYDLHQLADHDIGRDAVAKRELLSDVVKHKKVFFPVGYANYDACLNGGLRLVPDDEAALRADYAQMVTAGMFGGDVPSFDDVVKRLRALESQINAAHCDDDDHSEEAAPPRRPPPHPDAGTLALGQP